MSTRRVNPAHIDRMLALPPASAAAPAPSAPPPGDATRGRRGPPPSSEERHKVIALLPPELWAWAKQELLTRQLAGERVPLGDGRTRATDMGDLIGEALDGLRHRAPGGKR